MTALTDYAIEVHNADGSLRPGAEAAQDVFSSYSRARARAEGAAKVVACAYFEQERFGAAEVTWVDSHQAQVSAGGRVRATLTIVPLTASVLDEPSEAWIRWP